MILKSAIQSAVRKLEAQGLDDFEVAGLSEVSLVVEVKQQMVESFQRSSKRGIAIRAIRGARVGLATTTELSARSIEHAVDQAAAATRQVSPSDEATLPPAGEPPASFAEAKGRPFGEISDDDKIRMAMLLESAAIAADSRVRRVQKPTYEERTFSLSVTNSKGISSAAERGLALCELKVVAEDGGSAESAYEFSFSTRIEDLDVEKTARAAAVRAVGKLGAKPVSLSRCPVLLDPRASATMIRLAAPSFFADNVQRGKSMLVSKKGERIYHPDVSIVDDGLLPGGFGSFPFDGEGVTRRRTVMVRNGVVEGWLYDWARASRDGVASTGNCVREGLKRLPAIGIGNCFLKGGDKAPDALMREAHRGLLITDLLGVHTANAANGDFSLGVEGMLIEEGMTGQPVRGIIVAGNIHDLFGRVLGVGSDLKFFGAYGAPSLLVEGLMLGGG
ncbi:MAG: TldD/PmbA family protein [Pseudomonadota bacterium]